MSKYLKPRDIAVELAGNRRGTPFTPIQAFGLPLNEYLPEACRIAPGPAAEGVSPSPSAAPSIEDAKTRLVRQGGE